MNTPTKLNSRNKRAGKKRKSEGCGGSGVLIGGHGCPGCPDCRAHPVDLIKLDIGCGPNKKPGFVGADSIAFPGVDVVTDLCKPWPWHANSVSEAHSSHCLEHFDAMERVHFINELYRVLKPGAKATLICPHWSSCRAYGDPTHKWPPLSEFAFFYWKKDWRMANAPHTDAQHLSGGFNCNLEVTWGYSLNPDVASRNQEYQQYAMTHLKEACLDVIATLTAIK